TTQGDLVRRVECLEGHVTITQDLRLRFNYARATPWTREICRAGGERALLALAGPDGILITGPMLHWPQDGDGGARPGGNEDDGDAHPGSGGAADAGSGHDDPVRPRQ